MVAGVVSADTQKSGYITTRDGTQIHYVRSGSGTPLILLHGNGQSTNYFKAQMGLTGFETIAVDSRNHGKSGNSKKLTFEIMARDLLDLLDALHLKKADILGFSDGANQAMVFAKNYPERVDKLILNAGNLTLSDLHFSAQLTSVLQNFVSYTPVSRLLLKKVDVSKHDLEKFKMPVLVVVGENDMIKRSASKRIAKYSHAEFIEIPGGTHKVSQQQPKVFNRIITEFLNQSS
ncbi:hydrolase [Lactococcus insecticola]|uniref:Hydrolase n=2 Tax=Pseudolactococcus insecticola TaxID=2709158 RepID=A0A6A0B3N6_9LACT|nr:hydrolase [Lactococcus insecticola]